MNLGLRLKNLEKARPTEIKRFTKQEMIERVKLMDEIVENYGPFNDYHDYTKEMAEDVMERYSKIKEFMAVLEW